MVFLLMSAGGDLFFQRVVIDVFFLENEIGDMYI